MSLLDSRPLGYRQRRVFYELSLGQRSMTQDELCAIVRIPKSDMRKALSGLVARGLVRRSWVGALGGEVYSLEKKAVKS